MEFFPWLAHACAFAAAAISLTWLVIWYLLFRVWRVNNKAVRALMIIGTAIGGVLVILLVIISIRGWE